jgi:DNA adenine methylase
MLHRAKLRTGDFEEVVDEARPGDFVYFDPPYITGHQNNGFLKYNAPLFSWEDQQRLALVARRLARAGVFVLVSNADQESVLKLYRGLFFYRAVRRSLIAGPIDHRGTVTEAVLSNYPLLDCCSETL